MEDLFDKWETTEAGNTLATDKEPLLKRVRGRSSTSSVSQKLECFPSRKKKKQEKCFRRNV